MSKIFTSLLLLTLLSTTAFALYGNDDVVKLTKSNFKQLVLDSKDIWLVEFYAPWCGHCKNLAPEWKKAAKALQGFVKIGAVDMTTDQEAGSAYGIQGYPTLKFFGENKSKPSDYNGGRTANDIVNFALAEAKRITSSRLSGKAGGSTNNNSNNNNNNKQQQQQQQQQQGSAESDGDVVVLTDDEFDNLVMNSKEPWFVEFYAPWCGHCKSLAPEWSKLATNLKSEKIRVGKVDATVNSRTAQRFGVNGYPTLKFFPAGISSDSEAVDYNGGRDSSTLGSWAKEQRDRAKPVQFSQLLNQANFDESCTNNSGVCVIFFLPHIYDASAEQRRRHISIIEEIATNNKSKPLAFLWSQGGDQFNLEQKLNAAGSGFPSVIAISFKKNLYTTYRGSFQKKGLEDFVGKLLQGKSGFQTLPLPLPKVVNVQPWDGKDAEPQQTSTDDL